MDDQFRLGRTVKCVDGDGGVLAGVVTDPETLEVRYLVVERDHLRPRQIVVPIALLGEASEQTIRLDVTARVLGSFPDYEVIERHGRYEPDRGALYPLVGTMYPEYIKLDLNPRAYMVLRKRNVPDNLVEIKEGMLVRDCNEQEVGNIKGIVAEPKTQLAEYIIFDRALALHDERIVPAVLVADVKSTEIHLLITREQVFGLGTYSRQAASFAS